VPPKELNVLPEFLHSSLQCPVSGESLKHQKDRFVRHDGTFYPIVNGIPKLTYHRGAPSEDKELSKAEWPIVVLKSAWNGVKGRVLLGLDFRAEQKKIISMLRLEKGMKVLEVGPGHGCYNRWIREAVGPTGAYVVVDRSRQILESCREREGKDLTLIQSFGHSLPFKTGTFDAALCLNGVRYLKEPQKALTDLVRVVKPGGRLAWLGMEVRETGATWRQKMLGDAYPNLVWDRPEGMPGVLGFEVKQVFRGKAYLAVGYKK
jgi:hypothetical protein